MRKDWRGPSSSSTINSVRLRGLLAGGDATGLKGVSKGDSEGMADKLITAVGRFGGSGERVRFGRAARNGSRRAIGQLVRCVPTQSFIGLPNANAEYMAIRVRNGWIESGIRHGVFTVNIAGARAVTVPQVVRAAELVKPARSPVEPQRRQIATRAIQGNRVQTFPIGPINVDFKIPIGCGPERPAANNVVRKMKSGTRFGARHERRVLSVTRKIQRGIAAVADTEGMLRQWLPQNPDAIADVRVIAFEDKMIRGWGRKKSLLQFDLGIIDGWPCRD